MALSAIFIIITILLIVLFLREVIGGTYNPFFTYLLGLGCFTATITSIILIILYVKGMII